MRKILVFKLIFVSLGIFVSFLFPNLVLAFSGFGFPTSATGEKNVDVSQGLGQSHHLEGLAFELPGFLRSLKERLYI